GRKNMMEFNRKHNTSIKLLRGQAMKHTDMENLGLYLRQEIRKELLSAHTALPEIIVEGPYAMVKDRKSGTSLAMVLPDADVRRKYRRLLQGIPRSPIPKPTQMCKRIVRNCRHIHTTTNYTSTFSKRIQKIRYSQESWKERLVELQIVETLREKTVTEFRTD
uniref:Tick transposon n=1 Tax=Haemonchus contortus TaxID=6289 RepID=A0A7I4YMH2_HAECO